MQAASICQHNPRSRIPSTYLYIIILIQFRDSPRTGSCFFLTTRLVDRQERLKNKGTAAASFWRAGNPQHLLILKNLKKHPFGAHPHLNIYNNHDSSYQCPNQAHHINRHDFPVLHPTHSHPSNDLRFFENSL